MMRESWRGEFRILGLKELVYREIFTARGEDWEIDSFYAVCSEVVLGFCVEKKRKKEKNKKKK
jgi:hypothetical protein